jgi:hypothetical protein
VGNLIELTTPYRALVNATDKDNQSIFKGKPFTGFSNAEEVAVSGVEVSCISEFAGIPLKT